MPLFYFHLQTPEGLSRDGLGMDLPELASAYHEVCSTIPDLSAELLRERRDPMAYAFIIANADGETLIEVPFDETIRRRPIRRGANASRMVTTIERAQNLAADVYELNIEVLRNIASLRALLGDTEPSR